MGGKAFIRVKERKIVDGPEIEDGEADSGQGVHEAGGGGHQQEQGAS